MKKLRIVLITAKKRLRSPPPPFQAFNLITAPHSPNRSRLQLELFTPSNFVILSISQSLPEPARRPLPVAPSAPPSASLLAPRITITSPKTTAVSVPPRAAPGRGEAMRMTLLQK